MIFSDFIRHPLLALLALLAVTGMSAGAHAATTPATPTSCSAAASGYSPTTAAITLTWVDNFANSFFTSVKNHKKYTK